MKYHIIIPLTTEHKWLAEELIERIADAVLDIQHDYKGTPVEYGAYVRRQFKFEQPQLAEAP